MSQRRKARLTARDARRRSSPGAGSRDRAGKTRFSPENSLWAGPRGGPTARRRKAGREALRGTECKWRTRAGTRESHLRVQPRPRRSSFSVPSSLFPGHRFRVQLRDRVFLGAKRALPAISPVLPTPGLRHSCLRGVKGALRRAVPGWGRRRPRRAMLAWGSWLEKAREMGRGTAGASMRWASFPPSRGTRSRPWNGVCTKVLPSRSSRREITRGAWIPRRGMRPRSRWKRGKRPAENDWKMVPEANENTWFRKEAKTITLAHGGAS